MTETILVCPICGLRMPIYRRHSKRKMAGHVKTMFCVSCGEERNFIEFPDGVYAPPQDVMYKMRDAAIFRSNKSKKRRMKEERQKKNREAVMNVYSLLAELERGEGNEACGNL